MSDRTPTGGDPFNDGDPDAAERERRRAQREAQREARGHRRSLADRVSGALDGAAAKGREVVEQGRERVIDPPPPGEGAEPPPFRRTPAAPPAPASRQPAEEIVPVREGPLTRRRSRRSAAGSEPKVALGPPTREQAALADAAIAAAAARQAEGGPPATPPPVQPPAATPPPPAQPPARPPAPASRSSHGGSSGQLWLRRLLALAGVLVVAGGVAFAISRAGGEDPAPAPQGKRTLETVDVVIPEGLARVDMVAIAEDAGLKGDYENETATAPKQFDLEKLGAPADASLEGFLFPATYEVEKGAPVSDLVGKQLDAFNDNFAGIDMSYAEKKNLTEYDLVTIASMIEREVQVPKERPLVAAVIYNRLADGEPLGIDATLRYEVGFDKPLLESQLESDSPYNTRTVPGLPPTPIGNPGLDSLEAAADPADVDFKYYVFKPGSCNEHTFTDDYDEFLGLQAEYQAALEAEGGQPTDC